MGTLAKGNGILVSLSALLGFISVNAKGIVDTGCSLGFSSLFARVCFVALHLIHISHILKSTSSISFSGLVCLLRTFNLFAIYGNLLPERAVQFQVVPATAVARQQNGLQFQKNSSAPGMRDGVGYAELLGVAMWRHASFCRVLCHCICAVCPTCVGN